ncbi:MAG: GEVED domain-containing protein [Sphingobacteriaceae bacterium]|nr:GEVED domain-containing protein [Sphingobacteriaceae bacterium]
MNSVLLKFFLFVLLAGGLSSVSAQTYCPSGATSTADSKIDSVIVAGIVSGSSASSCETYTDNTALIGTVIQGSSYPIRVVSGTCGGIFTRTFKIFVDWDNDGNFNQAIDSIATLGPTAAVPSEAFTHTFVVPFGITPGAKRLRVVMNETSVPTSFTSCGTFTWGETEDYTLNVLAATGLDAGISSLVSPAAPLVGGSSSQVVVNIGNFRADPVLTGTVGYQIGNNPPVTETWSGSILQGQNATHTFATPFNLPLNGTFTIRTWFTNANGLGADLNTANDTLVSTRCISLPSGLYTIGASPTATYPSIAAAISALSCGGISGSVTLAIEPGTYYGSYTMGPIIGASITNQITITSTTGTASDVVLIHDTTAAVANKTIFALTNIQGVTFNALTFRRTQNQATGIFANLLATNVDNLTVLSCIFNETIPLTNVSGNSNGIRIDNGSSALITGNSFTGFWNSIFLTGPTANSNYEEFNNVIANTINNFRNGITLLNQSLAVVSGNDLQNAAAVNTGYGISATRVVGLDVSSNKVTGTLGTGGILISNPNDSLGLINKVVNNVISGSVVSISTFSSVFGINLSASFSATATNPVNQRDAIDVYHNTINITVDMPTTSTYGLLNVIGGGITTAFPPAWNAVRVFNNHVVGVATGAGLGINAVAALYANDSIINVLTSNNNNFHLSNTSSAPMANNLIRNSNGPVLFPTVAAWTTASGQDAASISANPGFTSTSLPIPTSGGVNNLGTPLASVPQDILGVQRSATTPDIGAYEFTPAPFDLAVIGIITQGVCSGPNQPISVRVRNVGTSVWNFATNNAVINVNVTGASTQTFGITINTDSLLVDSVRTYLVTSIANFTNGGTHAIAADLVAASDGNQLNNSNARNFTVVQPVATPYAEAFNGTAAPLNIVHDMTWTINIGVGQTGGMRKNVWASNIANIRTPIVGPLDTGAVFDFDYKVTNWSGWAWPGVPSVLAPTDTIKIELSTNCGVSFSMIDWINGNNHVTSSDFATKRVSLAAYAGQQVIMRLSFRQLSNIDVWFDVDNFRLFTPSPVDMGVLSILAPNSGCSLTGADSVRVRVVNFGTVSQSNIPVAYTVNGGTPVNATIAATMLPGDSLNYTFATTANLGAVGNYTIRAFTSANNDGDTTNDRATKVVQNYPVISTLPYLENFEGAATGWFAGGTNSTWALGTPAASIINAAASGTKAWATNLTGNYVVNENSFIQSPCFDLSGPGLVSPEVRFKLWYEVGQFDGGANVQFSTNGGATWQVLGSTTSGILNWYNNPTLSGSGTPARQGWSGSAGSTTFPGSGGYVEVAHSIAPLIGQNSVIFRIAFVTTGFATLRNGIAVDDFRVFQPLDPVITSVDTMASGCAVAPRTISASVFNFSPVTSSTLHYRLTTTGAFLTTPMTLNTTTNRWVGTIPAGSPNTRISYFVTTVDSASLRDTSGVLGYVDAYLQPNAGNDTTITAGGSATLRGSGGIFVGTIGTGTVVNTNTGYPSPYGGFYWGARHQFLILASELSASGINPGLLRSIAFSVNQPAGSPLNDFEIKLGHTTATDLNAWQPGTVQAFFAPSVTDTAGWNIYPFSTPFLWNGVSNLVVEVCFQNSSFTTNGIVNQTTTTFNSSYWYRADAPGVCANTLNTGSMMQRPNMRLGGSFGFEWRNLSTGALVTSTLPIATVSPLVTTNYEYRLNDASCTAADTMTVFVLAPLPDVGVTQVISPGALTLGSAHTVKVVVKNHGGVPATGFDVAYTVNGVEINANVVSRTIQPGDTVHHIFAQSFTPLIGGTIGMCAFTKSATDPNLANDTICMNYLNVSVNEVQDLLSRVYPNPADQFVKFDFSGQEGNGLLELRDNLGRVIHTEWIELSNGATHEVKTERYASGVYNYRFILRDKVQHGQVVIRR